MKLFLIISFSFFFNYTGNHKPNEPAQTGIYDVTVNFDLNSSVVKSKYYPGLDAIVTDLRADPKRSVHLTGYTARDERIDGNQLNLAKDRANAVKTYLVYSGIAAKRITTNAYASDHPIADDSTEEGRALNRRVEFKQK